VRRRSSGHIPSVRLTIALASPDLAAALLIAVLTAALLAAVAGAFGVLNTGHLSSLHRSR
jgi:hypothetical protein